MNGIKHSNTLEGKWVHTIVLSKPKRVASRSAS
jgi:hypothetical protein